MLKSFFSPLSLLFSKSDEQSSSLAMTAKEYDTLQQLFSETKSKKDSAPITITGKDVDIVKSIRAASAESNRNNVTRTEAYWQFFVRNPEIHWAFLAHLVSRNGGYQMTDLKGDLTGDLLSPSKKQTFFHFFERANALIFHDAFPQLLLYEKSKQQQKNLFHLLPAFSVSHFMSSIWNYYWEYRNDTLLALSLIINEQHYIEQRLISSNYAKNVLDTWQYALQNIFGFTQVVLPYYEQEKICLSGTTVQYFESVSRRIEIGRKLYSLLFGSGAIKKGAVKFAQQHPHTASRSDYAPSFFTFKKERIRKIYSPPLHLAWEDVRHTFLNRSDWFFHHNLSKTWFTIPYVTKSDITDDHFNGLRSLLVIKDHLFPLLPF
jgi:hypothetical protein